MDKKDYKYECPVCHIPRPFQLVHMACRDSVKIEIVIEKEPPCTIKEEHRHLKVKFEE